MVGLLSCKDKNESLLSCSKNNYNSLWLLMAWQKSQPAVLHNPLRPKCRQTESLLGNSHSKHLKLKLLKSAKNMGKGAREPSAEYFSFQRVRTLRNFPERALLKHCSAASVGCARDMYPS